MRYGVLSSVARLGGNVPVVLDMKLSRFLRLSAAISEQRFGVFPAAEQHPLPLPMKLRAAKHVPARVSYRSGRAASSVQNTLRRHTARMRSPAIVSGQICNISLDRVDGNIKFSGKLTHCRITVQAQILNQSSAPCVRI